MLESWLDLFFFLGKGDMIFIQKADDGKHTENTAMKAGVHEQQVTHSHGIVSKDDSAPYICTQGADGKN
jgi:hypothetical protein